MSNKFNIIPNMIKLSIFYVGIRFSFFTVFILIFSPIDLCVFLCFPFVVRSFPVSSVSPSCPADHMPDRHLHLSVRTIETVGDYSGLARRHHH